MNLSVVSKQSALFLLLLISLFTACTKIISTDIGGGLIPPIDGVITKEMFLNVNSKNIADTFAKVATSDIHALGYVNDPLLGKTTASINFQLKPTFPFTYPVKKDSLFLDSVVLILSYKGSWGDTSKPLALKVFEMPADEPESSIKPDSIYQTNYYIPSTGLELTQNNISHNVDVRTLNDTSHLRIRLNSTYGEQLLKDYDTAGATGAYKSDSLFSIYFRSKGYQIIPQQTGNSIMKVSLTDTATKLAIYFRYTQRDSAGSMDTTVRYFSCTSYNCASTNYIKRERTSSQVASYLPPLNHDTENNLIFIDANPGIYARVEIPGLDTISNKIIHRAELIMEQVADASDTFFTPPNLFLAPYSSDSMRRFVLTNDVSVQLTGTFYSVTNQFSFGCFPFRKTDPISGNSIYAYSFDMSRYTQGVITRDEKTYPFVLFAPFNDFISSSETVPLPVYTGSASSPLNFPAIGRVRLGGGNNVSHKMQLHIVYSEIP